MENLTIISRQSQKFVLVDRENDDYSATFWYCPFEKYNGGFFDETDLLDINVEFVHQVRESVSGWEYPIFKETKIYPGDDDLDCSLATKEALEVANEMIKQHQPKYV